LPVVYAVSPLEQEDYARNTAKRFMTITRKINIERRSNKMSNELMEYNTNKGPVKLTSEVVRDYLVSGKKNLITDDEIVHFMNMCRYQLLNPWLREAYLIKYSPDSPATMVVGKDVFLKRASRNPKFRGHKAEAVEDKDGTVTGAWAEVYIKDYQVPIRVTVAFKEYNQNNRMWNSKPKTMIRKVALAQALREAFPEDFEGLYSEEEMPTGDVELQRKPVKQPDIEDAKIEEDKPKETSNVTPVEIDELKKIAKEIGYKSLELDKCRENRKVYNETMQVLRLEKKLIAEVKDLREEREIEEDFLKDYAISDWNSLHRVTPERLSDMIEELKQLPLKNTIEKAEIKKETKAEKIQRIKDIIDKLGFDVPEVTKILQPYGAFNVKQLSSLNDKTLDKILQEEFTEG
jgi:phage recombination protein Bet